VVNMGWCGLCAGRGIRHYGANGQIYHEPCESCGGTGKIVLILINGYERDVNDY